MFRIVCLIIVIAAPGLTLAEEAAPDAKPGPNARALGMTEAILGYCAKVDPSAAVKYQERVKLLAQGAGEETLVEVRKSDEYQQGRDSVAELVGKVDEHNAKRVCSGFLAENK
jgi:hypothetical protein